MVDVIPIKKIDIIPVEKLLEVVTKSELVEMYINLYAHSDFVGDSFNDPVFFKGHYNEFRVGDLYAFSMTDGMYTVGTGEYFANHNCIISIEQLREFGKELFSKTKLLNYIDIIEEYLQSECRMNLEHPLDEIMDEFYFEDSEEETLEYAYGHITTILKAIFDVETLGYINCKLKYLEKITKKGTVPVKIYIRDVFEHYDGHNSCYPCGENRDEDTSPYGKIYFDSIISNTEESYTIYQILLNMLKLNTHGEYYLDDGKFKLTKKDDFVEFEMIFNATPNNK